jgi:hypothetical protein
MAKQEERAAEALLKVMKANKVTKNRLSNYMGHGTAWIESLFAGRHRLGYGKVWVMSPQKHAAYLSLMETAVREIIALDRERGGPPRLHGSASWTTLQQRERASKKAAKKK